MPRFVLLRHDCPPSYPKESHWDFLLETGATLAAWNLFALPAAWHACLNLPGEPLSEGGVDAQRLANHRLEYLDYEGKVSHNRGEVVRLDRGEYVLQVSPDDVWYVTLAGERLTGEVLLERQAGERWRLSLRG